MNSLAGMLLRMAPPGFTPSAVDGVVLMHAPHAAPRHPVVYEPSISIIAHGRKRGYLGEQVYTYDAKNYLVLSVPLPFECEIEEAPLLGVSVRVDAASVSALLLEMDERWTRKVAVPRAIYATPLDDDLYGAATRLLTCLQSPADARILGPQIVREIIYRVLCGPQGDALRALAARDSHFGQITSALRRIHAGYSGALDVEMLARESGMSVSAFHQHFKTVTASSPLQYLKAIRLHKARQLMVHDGFAASSAAREVGYESASQFSREFKRFFGNTPAEDAARVRAELGAP